MALTAGEGEQHQDVQEEELHDVHDHPAEGDLQGPEVRVHGEDVDKFERAAAQEDCLE